ncbi:major facilitator superfamily domain-containing protein [Dipodascopsis tothii]|uniref:major facilitator superfamily domain-containing protein n=1 Tax=Dipodascopsis tothii TaxID=44089 RepID=UPI0034CE59DE
MASTRDSLDVDETDALLEQQPSLDNPFTPESADEAGPSGSDDGLVAQAEELIEELSNAKLASVFVSLYMGVFLAALDGTIVATLLAHIASEFDEMRNVSWIATAYLIACAAFQPLYGKLTDIFGRKPGLVFASLSFGLGCFVCGIAGNLWVLVAGRVISGIGGGGLYALSTITLSDLVPLRKRGVLQGVGNILFGTGAALGGVFGGLMTSAFGWRWAFLVQVPFIAVSTLAIVFALKLPQPTQAAGRLLRVDFLGSFTLVVSLVLFLFAVAVGGNQLPWTHPVVVVSLPLSALIMGAFVYIERYVAKEPVIPVELLADRTIFGASFTNWFMTMSVYSILYYLPIYVIAVKGVSETTAGVALISNFVGVAAGSFASGVYMRNTGRYYMIAMVSAVSFVFGVALICTFGRNTSYTAVLFWTLFPGAGYGALLTITLIALIAAVPQKFQAVTTSIQYGFRGTGSTIGVALSSAVFQNVLLRRLHEHIQGHNADAVIDRIMNSVEEVRRLPLYLQPTVIGAYLAACRAVFVMCLVLGVCAGVSAMLMREHTLHNTLGRK